MKKGMVVFCLTIYIFCSVFVIPAQRASANPLAIPAGIEIGAGVYVTSVLIVAALAGAVGLEEYGSDIREHARAVWSAANDTVKQSLRDSVVAAWAAGEKVMTLSSNVYEFLRKNLKKVVNNVKNLVETQHPMFSMGAMTVSPGYVELIPVSPWDLKYRTPAGKEYFGSNVVTYFDEAQQAWIVGGKAVAGTASLKGEQLGNPGALLAFVNAHHRNYYFFVLRSDASEGTTWLNESDFDLPFSDGLPVVAVPPVSDFTATSTAGVPLHWDDATGSWVDGVGLPVDQTDVVINPPRVKVKEGQVVSEWSEGVVDVGTGEKVGEVAQPGEGVGAIEGIVTDILTGVRTIADVLTTGLIGDTSKINWDKLKTAGAVFTTSFPFSIPWDVGRALDAAFGSVEELGNAPTWEWKINLLGQQYPIRFKVDDYFLEWFGIIRSVVLILFDVGLVYAVRKMLGGAS